MNKNREIFLNTIDLQNLIDLGVLSKQMMKKEHLKYQKDGTSIEEDFAEKLRDECLELLDVIGFDENYAYTHEGVILQNLIDKLYL